MKIYMKTIVGNDIVSLAGEDGVYYVYDNGFKGFTSTSYEAAEDFFIRHTENLINAFERDETKVVTNVGGLADAERKISKKVLRKTFYALAEECHCSIIERIENKLIAYFSEYLVVVDVVDYTTGEIILMRDESGMWEVGSSEIYDA